MTQTPDITTEEYLWRHLKDLPYFRSMLRAVEASYYQHFDLPGPVLDIGSGDGHFASVTFEQPLDVGIDPWMDFNAHEARYPGHRNLIQTEGARLPIPDGYFASAISNSVLEHIEGIDAVLKDTARVLKQGAGLYFCVPNPRYFSELGIAHLLNRLGMKKAANAYRDWFRRISLVYHADEPQVWEQRLAQAGFVLERYWHYFSPATMRALEIGHFFGVPSLVAKKLFGRWILVPARWNLFLTFRYARQYISNQENPQGAFTFFVARRQ